MRIFALVCTIVCLAGALGYAATRTFTDKTGKHQIEAEFVGFSGGKVQLRKDDGSVIDVKMSVLSSDDQKWVRAELKRRRSANVAVDAGSSFDSGGGNGDWPQWRGPGRNGVSEESGLLDKWTGEPPLTWSVRGAGSGMSSVSVAGNQVITMGRRDNSEQIIAFNREDGSVLWNTPIGGGGESNCTPTIDGDFVFGVGRDGDLACVERSDGSLRWKKNFTSDFGGRMMSGWGYSESPLVDGDKLIVTPGSDNAILAALDKTSGEVIWQTRMPNCGGAGYASVVISHGAGMKQYVTLVGRGLIGVNAETGELLWHYPRIANSTANVPTPIVKGDYVFGSSGYDDGGSALLKLERGGQGVRAEEVYYKRNNELQNHHGGMVLIGDYVFLGHGHNNGFPACVELMSGRSMWGQRRGPGSGSAAIIAADGHLYFRYQDGTMALIEANPEGYNLKGTFRIASVNRESWPHPVIADKKLYLRDQDQLHCYDIADH